MTACERGVWIDTEGTIQPYFIRIAQVERQPLEDYCEGARKDSVVCGVKLRRQLYKGRMRQIHIAEISGIQEVAKEISLTRNCIRTKRKHLQIARFTESLKRPLAAPKGAREWVEQRRKKALRYLE